MANGWAPDGAVGNQIDDTVADAVDRARFGLIASNGSLTCEDCGAEIPPARREALPGARRCISCQSKQDARPRYGAINRRGSKDSQLR
jgi:phage/conjugal plasmid C-4 type zinc finger TraR family protein